MSTRRTRSEIWMPLAGWLVARALRLLGATWRVRVVGHDPLDDGRPVVGALWHESLFLAAHHFRDRGIVVMVSRSRDGDWIEAVLSRLGFAPSARGSSSRGGASALRSQVDAVRGGAHGALLCDGPRGPAREAKAGAVALASAAGAPLVPVTLSARPAWRFSSWDRTVLPCPFARVVVSWGELIPVPDGADKDRTAALREELQRGIEAAETRGRAALGGGG